mgnify:CR=1 FL=1
MKQEDLKILIDKFMSGTTTLDEEKALGDFFRQAGHLPAELEPYRDMFAYFDNGMTGEPSGKPVSHAAPVRSLRWIAGIAAAVAVIFVAAYQFMPGGTDETPVMQTSKSVVAQTTDSAIARPDTISDKERQADEMPAKRRVMRKYRFKPAPPEVLLADAEAMSVTDSVNVVAKQLADIELMKVECEQQYMLNLVKAASLLNSAQIAAVCDEEDVY